MITRASSRDRERRVRPTATNLTCGGESHRIRLALVLTIGNRRRQFLLLPSPTPGTCWRGDNGGGDVVGASGLPAIVRLLLLTQ